MIVRNDGHESDNIKTNRYKGVCHKLSKNNFYLPHNFHFVCAMGKFYYTRYPLRIA